MGDIKQFPSIKRLYLDDNCISDLKQLLSSLGPLENLEEISISGNPLTLNHLNWKAKIIEGINGLKKLNSEEISDNDRKEAKVKINKEKELLNKLMDKCISIKAAKEVVKRLNLRKGMGVGKGEHLPSMQILMGNAKKNIASQMDLKLYKKLKEKKLIEQ